MASRIRAMTVAGLTTGEIAGRLHTTPENIDAFLRLFFDVAEYVRDRTALEAIVAPLTEVNKSADQRERVWLLGALKLGARGLDYVMDQRVKLSAGEQDDIAASIHAILAEQSLSYTLGLHGRPECGGQVMEHYQRSAEMRLRLPPKEDDDKSRVLMEGLSKLYKERREAAERLASGNEKGPIQAAV